MRGYRDRVTTRCRYEAARREAIYTAERMAANKRRAASMPPPPSGRQIIVVLVLWAMFLAFGLWLAAHDPDFLSRVVQHAMEGDA